MSQRNIDVMRDQFAATNERDFPRAMSHYADEVVLIVSSTLLETGTFEGKEAVGRWFANWFATFEPGYHFEIEEIRDLGDRVFLDVSHLGRGRASGIEVTTRMGYIYTLRDAKITRAELFGSPAEALAALKPD
jgi:ketosteroid isomerase-like protein